MAFYHCQIFKWKCIALLLTFPKNNSRVSEKESECQEFVVMPGCWGGFHQCSDSMSPGLSAVIWPNPAGFGCMWEITARTLLSTLHRQKYVTTLHLYLIIDSLISKTMSIYAHTALATSTAQSLWSDCRHLLPFRLKSMQTMCTFGHIVYLFIYHLSIWKMVYAEKAWGLNKGSVRVSLW